MSTEEAIHILAVGDRDVGRVIEAMEMGIAALKREVPLRPKRGKVIRCPVCRWPFGTVEAVGVRCCPGCGQRIEWRGA